MLMNAFVSASEARRSCAQAIEQPQAGPKGECSELHRSKPGVGTDSRPCFGITHACPEHPVAATAASRCVSTVTGKARRPRDVAS